MQDNLTDIVCVIDRSGSMDAMRSDAIGGFNSFLKAQQQLPGDARLTVVLFNHEYHLHDDGIPLQEAKPLGETTYIPTGTTALLDAVGRTIDNVGVRLAATPEPERPGKVMVAILTDGLENASTDYSRDRVFEMIKHQREKYSWEFLFLAANQDAIATAGSLAIPRQAAATFQATGEGMQRAFMDINTRVTASRRHQ